MYNIKGNLSAQRVMNSRVYSGILMHDKILLRFYYQCLLFSDNNKAGVR
jgi:hypothetical protein